MTPSNPSPHESMIWPLIRAFGSLRIAMIEMIVIALVCALATVCESKFSTPLTQEWFDSAPWLLGLLCINLVCATLVRWPWRRKCWGFVATHYGIVLLMVGAIVGQKFGTETRLRLHTSAALSEKQMVFSKFDPVLYYDGATPSGYKVFLSADSGKPQVTIERPRLGRETFGLFSVLGKEISLAGDSTQISIQKYWPDFAMENGKPISKSEQPNNPAILVVLSGSGTPQTAIGHVMGVQVQLLQFDVPVTDGEPLDFRSTVRITNPKTSETLDTVISMNHPASFPPGFWRTALGRNCKFFQAEWNPNDRGETTLQAVYDPGWPLKWLGSLLACMGIAGMFYLK